MYESKGNNTYTVLNKRNKYEYLNKIAQEYLSEIYRREQCCVYTKEILRVMLRILPTITFEWNEDNECYYCYK